MHSNTGNPLNLAFGVEIENVFAFQKDLEMPTTPRNKADHLVALLDTDPSQLMARIVSLTGYNMVDTLSAFYRRHSGQDDNQTYNSWTLTSDSSICHDQVTFLAKLSDRVKPQETGLWEEHPNEIVSRILPAPSSVAEMSHPSFQEIRAITSILQGNKSSPFGIYAPSSCGLHVHVGIQPERASNSNSSPAFPLPVLQHFAYIQVQYEGFIAHLHSKSRRDLPESQAEQYCRSNLHGFRKNQHTCPKKGQLQPLSAIKEHIFSPEMTTERLAATMSMDWPLSEDELSSLLQWEGVGKPSQRYRIVNWTSLAQAPTGMKPRTLEFRQHDGCVDGDEICHWVNFCVALVRLAERLANGEAMHSINTWKDLDISTPEKFNAMGKSLLNLLQLPQEERQYWLSRLGQQADKDTFSPIFTNKELCRGCLTDHHHRLWDRYNRSTYKKLGMQGKKKATTKKTKKSQEMRARTRGRKKVQAAKDITKFDPKVPHHWKDITICKPNGQKVVQPGAWRCEAPPPAGGW